MAGKPYTQAEQDAVSDALKVLGVYLDQFFENDDPKHPTTGWVLIIAPVGTNVQPENLGMIANIHKDSMAQLLDMAQCMRPEKVARAH